MGNDLPDYQTEVVSSTTQATSFRFGLDANKPAAPAAGDVWLATDTAILYVCVTAGAWTNIGALYLPLAGGTMSGAIAMGSNKITGLAAPAANADAARKLDVDTVDAKLDDVTPSAPVRAVDTVYQNTSGKILAVCVSIQLSASTAETAHVLLENANPPTVVVATVWHSSGATGVAGVPVTFLVPPGWYYEIESTQATPTINYWEEYELL